MMRKAWRGCERLQACARWEWEDVGGRAVQAVTADAVRVPVWFQLAVDSWRHRSSRR